MAVTGGFEEGLVYADDVPFRIEQSHAICNRLESRLELRPLRANLDEIPPPVIDEPDQEWEPDSESQHPHPRLKAIAKPLFQLNSAGSRNRRVLRRQAKKRAVEGHLVDAAAKTPGHRFVGLAGDHG